MHCPESSILKRGRRSCLLSRYALSGVKYIEERPEISNPTNAWKRLIEGVYLNKQGRWLKEGVYLNKLGSCYNRILIHSKIIYIKLLFSPAISKAWKGKIKYKSRYFKYISLYNIHTLYILKSYYSQSLIKTKYIKINLKDYLRMTGWCSTSLPCSSTCTPSSSQSSWTTPRSPASCWTCWRATCSAWSGSAWPSTCCRNKRRTRHRIILWTVTRFF